MLYERITPFYAFVLDLVR